jgi:transcriptional regulator with XRE-family HTH domain
MEGEAIRNLRRRLGITQQQLGDRLGVDQATVSRWERGVENPRPSRQKILRTILIHDEEKRFLDRSLSIVRNDLMVSTLVDAKLHLSELSASSENYFRRRGRDPEQITGMHMHRYAERYGLPEMLDLVDKAGLLTGDAMMFRFTVTGNGLGNTTVWEPLFYDGEFHGMINSLVTEFEVPYSEPTIVEMAECIRTEDPAKTVSLFRGERADFVAGIARRSQ